MSEGAKKAIGLPVNWRENPSKDRVDAELVCPKDKDVNSVEKSEEIKNTNTNTNKDEDTFINLMDVFGSNRALYQYYLQSGARPLEYYYMSLQGKKNIIINY